MELLRRIWNHRPDPEKASTLQARALRGLALFLAVMVCCTIISRAADSMTIALVRVASPQRQTIRHTVTATGTLEAVERIPVIAEENSLVERLLVEEGDMVQEGDLLFVLDTTELQRQMDQKRLELQRLQLQLSAQREADTLAESRKDLGLERAEEDLAYAREKAERASAAALDEMNEARRARDDYDGDKDDDADAYEAAVKALRAEYRAKIRAYEQALADEAEALVRAERDIADAGEAEINIETDLLSLDCQLKQLEIAWIQDVLSASGEVYAPAAGAVTGLAVDVGKRTPGDASAYLVGEGALRFTAEITEEDKEHVERGNAVSLTLSGEQRSREGLQITSVAPIAGGSSYRVTVELPEGVGSVGLSAKAEITQTSQTYNACVPLSALYSEMGQYYVLVLRESESTLGLEHTVERLDVTVQEQNETTAAVSGALFSDSRVVRQADKSLASGDRVRLREGS